MLVGVLPNNLGGKVDSMSLQTFICKMQTVMIWILNEVRNMSIAVKLKITQMLIILLLLFLPLLVLVLPFYIK